MLPIMLQREWLDNAECWRKSAEVWSMSTQPDAHLEVVSYQRLEKNSREHAANAPVKVILIFADGREKVYE